MEQISAFSWRDQRIIHHSQKRFRRFPCFEIPHHRQPHPDDAKRRPFYLSASYKDGKEDDDVAENDLVIGRWDQLSDGASSDRSHMETSTGGSEKSRMADFVAQYLGRQSNAEQEGDDDFSSYQSTSVADIRHPLEDITAATHLIALPMDGCNDLLLELESVQRAILHHCPILLDACIPGAVTRLPLLYVQAPTDRQSSVAAVTNSLAEMVETLVHKHIFQKDLLATDDNCEDDLADNEDDGFGGPYLPLTMTFKSLEIDGDYNNVLYTVGEETSEGRADDDETKIDTSTNRLEIFVNNLRGALDAKGWKTSFPSDPSKGGGDETMESRASSSASFRPRVAFMELPQGFIENLSRFRHPDTVIDDQDMEFLTSDKGGNGISPIFWSQWWDDVFSKNTRLREVAIYSRNPLSGEGKKDPAFKELSSQFYVPFETIPLPEGNSAMRKSEKRLQEYQAKRIEEEQEKLYREMQDVNSSYSQNKPKNPDILLSKTRERLEKLFTSPSEHSGGLDDAVETALEDSPSDDVNPHNERTEDWMKEKIKKAVESLESVKGRQLEKKNIPPIEENPLFKAYKDGNLVAKNETPAAKPTAFDKYGNDVVGIWRVLTSPTGIQVDEPSQDSSENIVLRVDGTIAGGPTLDLETKQKAAGGTWTTSKQENGDVRLRIRMAIPPKKERILVMEGLVVRTGSRIDGPMPSTAFGIPHLKTQVHETSKATACPLTCSGDVYVEDAITKKNRKSVGEFSLMKLRGPMKNDQYTITIPKPVTPTQE